MNDARHDRVSDPHPDWKNMKILLPTDGSRYALAAARALSGWFAWPGGHVDVMAVTPEEPKSSGRRFGKDTESAQEWRATVTGWLEQTEAHLDASGLRVNRILREGDPATVVAESAAGGDYDLVAVGARGRSDKPHFDTGSVALALLERSPTSVLLVRERRVRGRSRRLPTPQLPLRVLLAIDGREPSQNAARALSSLVAADHVDIAALAVADAAEGGLLADSDAREVARRAASALEDHGFEAAGRVMAGDAAQAILDAAKEADLVVMGSRAAGGASRLGSVGLAVAQSSPCSVLIVREAAPVGAAEVEEEGKSTTPVEIAYENMEPSPAAERHVLRGLRRLERVAPDLMRVRVTLGRRNLRRRTGNLYETRLELMLPGPDIPVSRTSPLHAASEDMVTAIGEAFGRARRELIESRAIQRGDVKAHEAPLHGEVTDLFPDHGFIRSSDGRVVYFHRNSVGDAAWDELEVGHQVRFRDEPGEEGPHATFVTVLRGRHTVG